MSNGTMRAIAHNSGDGITCFHCPFCGSGAVIARSDNSIECQFCGICFSVQVQPQYAAFPQTINGVPVQVPGVPVDPTMGQPPMGAPGAPDAQGDPNAQGGMPDAPFGQEDPDADEGDQEDEEDEEDSSGDQPKGNPFTSSLKSFADFTRGR